MIDEIRRTFQWIGVQHVVMLFLLFAAVFLAYGQSVAFGFVWDDYGLILHNDYIKQQSDWAKLFVHNFWQIVENVEDQSRSFYRPVITLSYAVEYAMWGTSAAGYHMVNVLAHGVCVWLVYGLCILLFGSRLRAFVVALFFAILPIHVENVYWISGRTDVFCGLFFLVGFISYLRWSSREDASGVWFGGFTLGYCLSLLCKEMAMSFPLIVLAYYILCQRGRLARGRFRSTFLFLVLITSAYLFIRYHALGELVSRPIFGSEWERLISIPMVFCKYLALLMGFNQVDPHHDMVLLTSVRSHLFAGCLLGCLGYLVLLLYAYRLRLRRVVFFGVWIPLTLLPVMRLGAFGDILVADRFLYLPSVGYAYLLMLACVLVHRKVMPFVFRAHSKCVMIVLIVAFCVVQIGLTNGYGVSWENDLLLFSRAVKTSPRSAYIYNNYGSALEKNGFHEQALKAYVAALTLVPNYGSVHAKMGFSLKQLERYEEAVECFLQARALDSHSVMLYNNLGFCFRELGYLDSAMQCYRLSILLQPNEPAYNNLGECLMALGNYTQAESVLRMALELNPTTQANNNLGLSRLRLGDPVGALRYFSAALCVNDQAPAKKEELVVRANLARALSEQGRVGDAVVQAGRVVQLLNEGVKNGLDEETHAFVIQLARIADRRGGV